MKTFLRYLAHKIKQLRKEDEFMFYMTVWYVCALSSIAIGGLTAYLYFGEAIAAATTDKLIVFFYPSIIICILIPFWIWLKDFVTDEIKKYKAWKEKQQH